MTEKKPRILIADDFEDYRTPLRMMLKLAGFEVLEAENGQQAVEMTRREKPDLALIDVTLPVIDGLQVTRQILSEAEFRFLPIIIVSGHDSEEVSQQAAAAGAAAYISKRIEFEELKKLIGDCLKLS
jgi:CheY-like chemotaxis protein